MNLEKIFFKLGLGSKDSKCLNNVLYLLTDEVLFSSKIK